MTENDNPRRLSLSDLQKRCAAETVKYLQAKGDDAWNCYEIFRRAIAEKNNAAWNVIVEHYWKQVLWWVEHHPRFSSFSEGGDNYVNLVFTKFWKRGFTPAEFSGFPNVKSILAYIKTCVGSVITDALRLQKRKEHLSTSWEEAIADSANWESLSYLAGMEDLMAQEDFWEEVRTSLAGEKAFLVIYATFASALRPVDIYANFPAHFEDVREVYKVKAKALADLKQSFGTRKK